MLIVIQRSCGPDSVTGVDEVCQLFFHLRRLEPLGHEIDRHHVGVYLGHGDYLAVDAVF